MESGRIFEPLIEPTVIPVQYYFLIMTNVTYIRFWFEFDIENAFVVSLGIAIGCWVTAYNYSDALKIMDEKIFFNKKRPAFKKVVEEVYIRTLDQGYVISDMSSGI